MSSEMKKFPKGCTIVNIRQGKGARKCWIYADLRAPNGDLLISAHLEYINKQLIQIGIES